MPKKSTSCVRQQVKSRPAGRGGISTNETPATTSIVEARRCGSSRVGVSAKAAWLSSSQQAPNFGEQVVADSPHERLAGAVALVHRTPFTGEEATVGPGREYRQPAVHREAPLSKGNQGGPAVATGHSRHNGVARECRGREGENHLRLHVVLSGSQRDAGTLRPRTAGSHGVLKSSKSSAATSRSHERAPTPITGTTIAADRASRAGTRPTRGPRPRAQASRAPPRRTLSPRPSADVRSESSRSRASHKSSAGSNTVAPAGAPKYSGTPGPLVLRRAGRQHQRTGSGLKPRPAAPAPSATGPPRRAAGRRASPRDRR